MTDQPMAEKADIDTAADCRSSEKITNDADFTAASNTIIAGLICADQNLRQKAVQAINDYTVMHLRHGAHVREFVRKFQQSLSDAPQQ